MKPRKEKLKKEVIGFLKNVQKLEKQPEKDIVILKKLNVKLEKEAQVEKFQNLKNGKIIYLKQQKIIIGEDQKNK